MTAKQAFDVTAATNGARQFQSPRAVYIGLSISLVLTLASLLLPLTREVVGILSFVNVTTMILVGVPIGIAMIAAGAVGLLALGGLKMIEGTFEQLVFNSVASWQLSVIPMFILMGIVLWRSGVTTGAYEAARAWLGRLPGGLAVATNFAGAGLAGTTGSSIAISYSLGKIAIPEMIRSGYRPSLATGTVISVGTLGQLVPPSILLVIYAGIAQTPVGPQLLAAFVPAACLAVLFAVAIMAVAIIKPSYAPKADLRDVTWSIRLRSLVKVIPLGVVMVVIGGGIFTGIVTATESGALGVVAAFVVAYFFGSKEFRGARGWVKFAARCALEAAVTTAAIFLMVMGVTVLSRLITLTRIGQSLTDLVVDLGLNAVTLMLVMIVVYFLLGTFLEPLAMMLIVVPVLAGTLAAVGVDLLWFGVFTVIMAEVAVMSPPLGVLVFIVYKLAQDPLVNLGKRITLISVFNGLWIFMGAAILLVVLMIFFPEIATWLPSISKAS